MEALVGDEAVTADPGEEDILEPPRPRRGLKKLCCMILVEERLDLERKRVLWGMARVK